MDPGTAALGLSAAQLLERSSPTCTGPDASESVNLSVARVHQACVEPFWSSSLETRIQTAMYCVSDSPGLETSFLSCQDGCPAAVARFTSSATPVSCTHAGVSLASATSCPEAKIEPQSCECMTTVLLRSAALQAHMSAYIPASYRGGRVETIRWTCLMSCSCVSCAKCKHSRAHTREDQSGHFIALHPVSHSAIKPSSFSTKNCLTVPSVLNFFAVVSLLSLSQLSLHHARPWLACTCTISNVTACHKF